MKKPLDVFSSQSDGYKKFRPTYPQTLYDEILSHVGATDHCWDCGTGNGQVAVALAPYFKQVYATDISKAQLTLAEQRDNILYQVERAEKTTFPDSTFDLVVVAQALHWFDFDAFNKEVLRVSKNGAVIGVWGYGLLRISEAIDKEIDHFYKEVVGPYWNAERRHIDTAYGQIPFDFVEIPISCEHTIKVSWGLSHLVGYFNSWSSVQHYQKDRGKNPVETFAAKLANLWDDEGKKNVRFPIFMKMGRILK